MIRGKSRSGTRAAALGVLLGAIAASGALAQPAEDPFTTAQRLRANGEFDGALDLLSAVLRQPASDDVLRRAHNELVATYLFKRNATIDTAVQKGLYDEIVRRADAALARFPDLDADPQLYPAEINLIYDTRRALLFGSVELTANTDSCSVFVNDEFRGITPLVLPYVPVGDYIVKVTRDGYDERTLELGVTASSVVQREVALSKHRGKGWWLTRVVAPVAAGVAVVVALVAGGDDTPPETVEEPLDLPPDPPTR